MTSQGTTTTHHKSKTYHPWPSQCNQITWHHIRSHHVTLHKMTAPAYHMTSHDGNHGKSHHITWQHITPHHMTARRVTSLACGHMGSCLLRLRQTHTQCSPTCPRLSWAVLTALPQLCGYEGIGRTAARPIPHPNKFLRDQGCTRPNWPHERHDPKG